MDNAASREAPLVDSRWRRAYRKWQRSEERLARLKELGAPDGLIDNEVSLRDDALAALRALGWAGGPVRNHHTPFDLDRGEPPAAARVLKRALVLAAIAERALLEANGDANAIPGVQEWARCVDDEFEPGERALMFNAPGSMSEQQLAALSWEIEAAAALAWALGLAELCAHDRPCAPRLVMQQLGLLVPDRLAMSPAPALRPREAITREFERMFAVHWRLHDYRVRPKATNFAALGSEDDDSFWFGPLATAGIPTAQVLSPEAGKTVADMAILGHAISEASDDDRGTCEAIVRERRKALGWACGQTVRYSDVPVDT